MKISKAFAILPVLLIVSLVAGGVMAFKPKWLHGESKRATASVVATAKVEESVVKADKAVDNRSANAAAKVATILTANNLAPESPSKQFIAQEAPSAMADLPAPDPLALLAAERRRVAVMEGDLRTATALYNQEAKKGLEMAVMATKAASERDAAMAKRREADTELVKAANEHLAQERLTNGIIILAVLFGAGWVYTKLTHLSPSGMGHLAADIRAGYDPLNALDVATPLWMHSAIQKIARLNTPISSEPTKPLLPALP